MIGWPRRNESPVELLAADEVKPAPKRMRELQFTELDRLVGMLEAGSSSLNQRATTLAGLAVAALGVLGVLSSRLADSGLPEGFLEGAAFFLFVASAASFASALLAIRAAVPGENWPKHFACRANFAMRGELMTEETLRSMRRAISYQLERNQDKVFTMSKAYYATACALGAAGLAVAVILAGLVFG